MAKDPATQLYTIQEVADRCRVSTKTIRRHIDKQLLGCVRLGHAIRITEAQYVDWVRRHADSPRL